MQNHRKINNCQTIRTTAGEPEGHSQSINRHVKPAPPWMGMPNRATPRPLRSAQKGIVPNFLARNVATTICHSNNSQFDAKFGPG